MRTVKRIFPFIIVLAVLCSALTINFNAVGYTTVAKVANIIYYENSDYKLIQYTSTSTSRDRAQITYNGNTYYTEYRKPGVNVTSVYIITDNNDITLITNNSTWQYVTVDINKNLYAAYRITNGYFQLGFTNANSTVNPNDYTGINYALAVAYSDKVSAGTNNWRYSLEYFALTTSSTLLQYNSIITGNVGEVYQGIVKLPDNVFYNTITTYNYTIENNYIVISWYIQDNIGGISYYDNGLYLIYGTESMPIPIPEGNNISSYYYDFGILSAIRDSSNNRINYNLVLNGSIYVTNADPLHSLVTELIYQAFDIRPFNDTVFVWCTEATIDQDLTLSVINNQLVIINQIGKIVNFIEDSTTVDLSEPGFDDMFGMIDTQDFLDAKAMLDEVDLNSHISGVSFIINTASYAFINPVISTVLLSILFAFSVAIMVIKGLRR